VILAVVLTAWFLKIPDLFPGSIYTCDRLWEEKQF
jgi:hypothetical protein